jgi:hypothetical protein
MDEPFRRRRSDSVCSFDEARVGLEQKEDVFGRAVRTKGAGCLGSVDKRVDASQGARTQAFDLGRTRHIQRDQVRDASILYLE